MKQKLRKFNKPKHGARAYRKSSKTIATEIIRQIAPRRTKPILIGRSG